MSKSESKLSGKPRPNVFGEYLSKQVQEILSPKKVRRLKKNQKKPSPTRKIQTLRRSSRIASSRKVYDGKRKNKRRRSKLKSRLRKH
jgi:hypothetical protein